MTFFISYINLNVGQTHECTVLNTLLKYFSYIRYSSLCDLLALD